MLQNFHDSLPLFLEKFGLPRIFIFSMLMLEFNNTI